MRHFPRCFALLKIQRTLAAFIVIAGCGGDGASDPTSTGSSSTSGGSDGTSLGTAETAGSESGTGDDSTGNGAKTHPCSREISFKRNLEGDNVLVVADVDGSEPTRVTESVGVISFSWSPDGRRFVYSAQVNLVSSVTDLFLGDLAGEGKLLVESAENERFPEWAPVGDTIAFTRTSAEAVELWTVDAGTGVQTLLTRVEGATAFAFDWSPNADALALAVERGADQASLLRISAGGGEPEVLVKEEEMLELTSPAWAPDGATIAFSGRADLFLQGYTIPAAGGVAERVTEGFGYQFEWSPDATTLVYRGASVGTSDFRLFMVVPGSGPEVELLPDLDCRLPRWCDAPELIVAQCHYNDSDHVIVVDAQGGAMQEIASPGINDREPRWRPEVL